MKTLGRHLIIELYGCDPQVSNDPERLRVAMGKAAAAVGATVVAESFHHYAPVGVSGTLAISESHLSVHTWPESGYVAVDIFTCGGLDPRPGVTIIASALGAQQLRQQEIIRGLAEDVPTADLLPADVQVMTTLSTPQTFPGDAP